MSWLAGLAKVGLPLLKSFAPDIIGGAMKVLGDLSGKQQDIDNYAGVAESVAERFSPSLARGIGQVRRALPQVVQTIREVIPEEQERQMQEEDEDEEPVKPRTRPAPAPAKRRGARAGPAPRKRQQTSEGEGGYTGKTNYDFEGA